MNDILLHKFQTHVLCKFTENFYLFLINDIVNLRRTFVIIIFGIFSLQKKVCQCIKFIIDVSEFHVSVQ